LGAKLPISHQTSSFLYKVSILLGAAHLAKV
jgi:hypothetical protein